MNKFLETTDAFIDLLDIYISEEPRCTDAVRVSYGRDCSGKYNCSLEQSTTEGICPFVVLTAILTNC